MSRERVRYGASLVALAGAYWAAAAVGFTVADSVRQVSPLWPPTGIALAAMVRLGARCWPGIAAGAFLANLGSGEPPWTALAVAAGNTLEAIAGYAVLRRFAFDARVERMWDVYALVVTAVAAPAISASLGVANLWQAGLIPPAATLGETWLVWWVGDAMGALLVTPVLLTLTDRRLAWPPPRAGEAVVFLLVLAALGFTVLATVPAPATHADPNLAYLVFPMIIWAALRFTQREVVLAVALVSTLAVAGAIHGRGPFVSDTLTRGLVLLQVFMAVLTTTALAMGALVTERRRAYDEVRRANAAKDEFLAVLSHELRTPLTPILGWIRLLRDGQLDAPSTQRAHEVIERNTRIQVRLVEDLLDASRIVSGKMVFERHLVDLVSVVAGAHETVRGSAAEKSIAVEVEPPAAKALAWGDAERLQQAVTNVLANAVKFTPPHGRIRVRIEDSETHLVLSVSDTGQGIEPAFLRRMFAPFTQADTGTTRSHGGLGLGLSIACYIVEQHGGTVAATSAGLGRGTTLSLKLRRARTTAVESAAPETPSRVGRPLAGVKVLAVDDDPDACEIVRVVLNGAGADVRTAGGADAALEISGQWEPDVLVSDLAMPGADGLELLHTIRRRGAPHALKAVLLTAYAGEAERGRALAAGYDAHLPKPVSPADLVAALVALRARE
jgi:signal transduction histidine kinase